MLDLPHVSLLTALNFANLHQKPFDRSHPHNYILLDCMKIQHLMLDVIFLFPLL